MTRNDLDLEAKIMECWWLTSELKVLSTAIMEDETITEDKIVNILLGLEQLYDIKFTNLFEAYCKTLEDKV